MASAKKPARVKLVEVLDLGAAAPLKAELLTRRGGPIEIDASAVQRAGGLCLQVLLSASATWAVDGHEFNLAQPSEALCEAIRNLGAADFAAGLIEETIR